jgi:hypothetical protein
MQNVDISVVGITLAQKIRIILALNFVTTAPSLTNPHRGRIRRHQDRR